ncbi:MULTISPECIES: hypothetical protein [unclassified Streptomyces]|uniref:Uncharacterized protein n=1 Tax=Streptomyces sp. NBC_00060 TaxID=2975636 RepID=A0AAU2H477_9ACTN
MDTRSDARRVVVVEYRCRVTATPVDAGPHEETALGATCTPSPALAASWLRAQASLLVWRLEPGSAASAQLMAWRDDETEQRMAAGALVAGQPVRFRVLDSEITYELSATRVIRKP